ncbi:MAG: hypothetical protein IJT97_07230 [Bacteroidaceae bacterium]|nr:hypothetical protein [Bacteroidaceae bacterium]
MKVFRNKLIPFGRRYAAINLFGIVFAKCHLSRQDMNHEYIHTLQQRELLFVGFYIIYIMEWLLRLIQYRNTFKAYLNISFEREAYDRMKDLNYAQKRKILAWTKYIRQNISKESRNQGKQMKKILSS